MTAILAGRIESPAAVSGAQTISGTVYVTVIIHGTRDTSQHDNRLRRWPVQVIEIE